MHIIHPHGHKANDAYPLVLHGYLRGRIAKHVLSMQMLRCVLLGIIVWDTCISLYQVILAGRGILSRLNKSRGCIAALWGLSRIMSLCWISLSVHFPVSEFKQCTQMVKVIASMELVMMMLVSLLMMTVLIYKRTLSKWQVAILGLCLLTNVVAQFLRTGFLKSYTFVEDRGMCSWDEQPQAFLISLVLWSVFWLTAATFLTIQAFIMAKRGYSYRNPNQATEARNCLFYVLPVVVGCFTLIWTYQGWHANTYGSIQPVNLAAVTALIATCKLGESMLMDKESESEIRDDDETSLFGW